MEKINEKDLKFLDFILQIFSEDINAQYDIDVIAKEYKIKTGVKFNITDLRTFTNEYENKYLIKFGNDFIVTTDIKTKRIIDEYGSLSNYLHPINHSSSNRFLKIIRPIIASIKRLNKIWKSIIYIILTGIGCFIGYLLIELYKYIITKI